MSPRERVAAWIKRRRTAAGLSQEALAKRVGLSQAMLSKLEHAATAIDFEKLLELFAALRVRPARALSEIESEGMR